MSAESRRIFTSSITWLAVRWDYARPPRRDEPLLDGVGWLLFGSGVHGAGWLSRIRQSAWFAGLEPQLNDLGHGIDAHGHWPILELDAVTDENDLTTKVEAFVASAPLPQAWCAAVAVPPRIGPAESAIVLGLVGALRAKRDPLGRQVTVVATMDDAGPLEELLAGRLRDRGAFVIRGSAGASGDHLHHYPLRATTQPREGRLICVDFADFLHTWRPGRCAALQTISGDLEVEPGTRGCALNILFHVDLDDPNFSLLQIDRLASELLDRRLDTGGDAVFTTSDRLDGQTGTVDLLVIEEATALRD